MEVIRPSGAGRLATLDVRGSLSLFPLLDHLRERLHYIQGLRKKRNKRKKITSVRLIRFSRNPYLNGPTIRLHFSLLGYVEPSQKSQCLIDTCA